MRDIFDDPCVALRVQATLDEFGTGSVLADIVEQQVTAVSHRPHGNRRASELRRAETGLVKVRRLLSGADGSQERHGTRTRSNSALSQPFKCNSRGTVVGADGAKPNPSRLTTLRHVSVSEYAYPAEGASRHDVMQDGNRASRKRTSSRFSNSSSLGQVYTRLPSRLAGNYITYILPLSRFWPRPFCHLIDRSREHVVVISGQQHLHAVVVVPMVLYCFWMSFRIYKLQRRSGSSNKYFRRRSVWRRPLLAVESREVRLLPRTPLRR